MPRRVLHLHLTLLFSLLYIRRLCLSSGCRALALPASDIKLLCDLDLFCVPREELWHTEFSGAKRALKLLYISVRPLDSPLLLSQKPRRAIEMPVNRKLIFHPVILSFSFARRLSPASFFTRRDRHALQQRHIYTVIGSVMR